MVSALQIEGLLENRDPVRKDVELHLLRLSVNARRDVAKQKQA